MTGQAAVAGGRPVRAKLLPYGRQDIDDEDIAAVVRALRSDWLTTGPEVDSFERELAAACGVPHAVAVCNGTAALHSAYAALGIGPGDEVVVPAITFAATANAVLHAGGRPVFADVEADTLLLDPAAAAARLTPRTRAIVGVDFAGQPCDWNALGDLAARRSLRLVDDAAHSLGGSLAGRPVGSLADATTLSFHPVKHITTGEGGAVVTRDGEVAARVRVFRNHGIASDHRERAARGTPDYDMVSLGWNYRLTDLQCALGRSQLRKLPAYLRRRRALAARYRDLLASVPGVEPLAERKGAEHAYHLLVVRLEMGRLRTDRAGVHRAMRAEGIGTNVHYAPVHLHPFYRQALGTAPGDCPVAEAQATRILTLPLFPAMAEEDVDDVVVSLRKVMAHYGR